MSMTDADEREAALEPFFAAARADAPAPSPELMARVLEAAGAEQARIATPAPVPRAGLWARIRQGLGGWPAVAGLAAAGLAGVWIGLALPEVADRRGRGRLRGRCRARCRFRGRGGFLMSQERGGPGRGWRIVLIVSLALNLLIAGAIGGWVLRHGIGPHGRTRPAFRALAQLGGPLTHALDAEGRAAIAARLRAERGAHEARRAALREGFEALLADLRAQPFDRDRVAARLDAQRAQVAGRFQAGHAALVAHLAQMSAPERAAYADRLEEKLRRWRRHHRHAR